METKYETVADIIAERDRFKAAALSPEGEWVGHKDLATLRKDAERYRWLRGGKGRTTGQPKRGRIEVFRWDDKSEGSLLKGDDLDAAVDADMAARAAVGAA